jgi:cell division protein FtsB
MAAEIQALKQQMAKMSGEVENLKKQISQLVTFIKQRL